MMSCYRYMRYTVALSLILILGACALPPQYPERQWTVDDLPKPYSAYRMF